jgi:DNA topoisomerase-1
MYLIPTKGHSTNYGTACHDGYHNNHRVGLYRLYAKKQSTKEQLSWEDAGRMGTTLVIVESPAKAKTIQKFLDEAGDEGVGDGGKYVIDFCAGHIRDLLSSKNSKTIKDQAMIDEIAKIKKKVIYEGLKLKVSDMGVDVEDHFKPIYVPMSGKEEVISRLRRATKAASRVLLATDEDREGEAISWHLTQVLGL